MKKLILIAAMALLPLITQGQEAQQRITDPASMELNFSRALWFNSSNAAGMAVGPLHDYNIVSARYDLTSGDYKLTQRGDRESALSFNTNGALLVGKVALWGDFTFSNDYWTGTTFNTGLFEPDPDMPYYVSDPNKGDWNKQSYDMSVKAATPLLWNRVSFGMELNYTTRKAAKQIDPRGITASYSILVKPSALLRITDKHYAGLSFNYRNSFERIEFTNVLESAQTVFLMKGLGNFTADLVRGTQGIKYYYYPRNQWGAGLQYGFPAGRMNILLDMQYGVEKYEAFQSPSQPKPMGQTDKKIIDAGLQLLWNGNSTHKVTVDYRNTDTDGTEFLVEADSSDDIRQWKIISELNMSNYAYTYASLEYDLFLGTQRDYSWRTGVMVSYSDRYDQYYAPQSIFSAQNVYGQVYIKKNLGLDRRWKVLLGLEAGYNYNLGGEYVFGGSDRSHTVVTDFYPADNMYFTADYTRLGCSADFSWSFLSRNSLNLGISWKYIMPDRTEGTRSFLNAAVSLIF